MGMRPTDRDIEQRERERVKQGVDAHRATCIVAVKRWNEMMAKRQRPPYAPMIGVAIEARFYYLDLYCPGCRQRAQVDLRTLDRHPQTTVEALIPSLSCRNCQPSPPFARLVCLSEHAWASPHQPAALKRGI
jgi:hypothetical protein